MASHAQQPAIQRPVRAADLVSLKVSAYDRVASMLVALLILVGFTVLLLVMLWLTNQVFASHRTPPTGLVEVPGDDTLADAEDLEPPGAEELADVAEPELADTLASVTDISTELGAMDDIDGQAARTTGSHRAGDARQKGTTGDEMIPRHQRWEIRFAATTLPAYARQLDFFGIELGVLGRDGKVRYAYNLAKGKPDQKTGAAEDEKRLYFSWRGGQLQEADKELLGNAGVNSSRGIMLQFYLPHVEESLAQAEQLYAGGRDVKEIRKTVFGVKSEGAEFRFFVADQEYRSLP